MAPPPPQVFKRDGPTMFVKRQGPSDTDTGTTTPTSSSSSTTPTSSSTTPSSSSSTTPTSSSTTPSSSSSSTSTTPTSTTPSSTSTPTPTLNTSASTRPDGGVVTLTLTSTPSATPTGSKGGGGGGFWNNKAEVGAVFGIAGAIGLVLIFIAVTTAVRRRRARKFDRDVAEAAAAAASASANPFFDDEDERGNNGANWDPRRGSAYNAGYGKIHDDPYGYAAAGVVGGAAAGAGFARQNTNQFQQRNPQDAYSMNDLASSGHQMSSYSGATTYNQSSSGAGYYDMPQPDYGRPSFSSNTTPGIAGVGAAGALAGAGTGAGQNQNQNQNLRYRGQPQQQRPLSSGSDAYGGYSDDYDRYPNPYAANPASTAFVQNTPGSQEGHGNMVNQAYRAQSPPGRQTSPPLPAVPNSSSPPPPPSYSGHGHTNSAGQDLKFAGAARPSSEWQHGLVAASGSQGQLAPMAPPNASLPATPDESYDQKGRILRVANE